MEERRENEADERVCSLFVGLLLLIVLFLCALCAGENAIDRRGVPQAKVSVRCVLAIIFDVVLLSLVDILVFVLCSFETSPTPFVLQRGGQESRRGDQDRYWYCPFLLDLFVPP